jgi:uncharacterized membrane-anchored protein YitT (DUF2179 family)
VNQKNKILRILSEYLLVSLGTFFIALSLHLFLAPNTIAPGGVSGLSIIIEKVTGIPIFITNLAFNVPLFLAGLFVLGRAFGAKTGYATLLLSLMLWALGEFGGDLYATKDVLLASVFGGILTGLGVGLVFRNRASTGGTDLAGSILNRFFPHISTAKLMMTLDIMVIVLAGIASGNIETSLYSMIALYIIVKVADFIVEGLDYSKQFMIITERPDEIGVQINQQIRRGVTSLKGRGMYSGSEREVLLCVVNRSEVIHVKEIVKQIDSRAFVMVSTVHEVLGEGFREIQNQK